MNFPIPDELIEALAERIADKLRGSLPSQPNPQTPWLTADETAHYIGAARQRIYDLVSDDRIPVHREGSRLLFHRGELDGWIASGAATFGSSDQASVEAVTTALPPFAESLEARAFSESGIAGIEGVKRAA
jgi:excisionase family DNA binding protein